jgi:hypothetical protein
MNTFPANRRSPLGLFPAQPTPRFYDPLIEVPRTRHYSRRIEQAVTVVTRHWRFLVMPTGKGFIKVSLNKS